MIPPLRMIPSSTLVTKTFDQEFVRLHERSCHLIKQLPSDSVLYTRPRGTQGVASAGSVGECILRSAGAVEQTFGGITSNLWDDPHEWTLPETLGTRDLVINYLMEVEETRQRAFAGVSNDAELLKNIMLPSEEIRPLIAVLLETLVRASELQGEAVGALKSLSNVQGRGVII